MVIKILTPCADANDYGPGGTGEGEASWEHVS
jgi:hypothetical protein